MGIMGHGMAVNFLKNGYELYVWNRSPEKAAELVKSGAKLSRSDRRRLPRLLDKTAKGEDLRPGSCTSGPSLSLIGRKMTCHAATIKYV